MVPGTVPPPSNQASNIKTNGFFKDVVDVQLSNNTTHVNDRDFHLVLKIVIPQCYYFRAGEGSSVRHMHRPSPVVRN